MSPTGRLLPLLVLLAGLVPACTLTFTPETLQALRLFFEVSSALPEGEATLVHTLVHPGQVKVRKRFLRVAGELDPDGGSLPARLELVAETIDVESGAPLHRLALDLRIAADGTFSAVKKLKKNFAAGSMTTVTLEPIGDDLDRGTRVVLCVDVVKRKADLDSIPCLASDDDGSDGGEPEPETFGAIQEQIFTPSCAKGGCHSSASASAGLVLAAGSAYAQLVNVPSNQVPFRLRVAPGDPDNSYLMMKLRGEAGIQGVRMPLDGPPFLTEAQLDGIASWIARGAPND